MKCCITEQSDPLKLPVFSVCHPHKSILTSNVKAIDLTVLPGFQRRKFTCSHLTFALKVPHPGYWLCGLSVNCDCYPFPHLCSPLLFEIISTSGTGSSFSSAMGLLVNIINMLSIGNLFHTLVLSLPKLESSCNKYGVRQPSPWGGKGREWEDYQSCL